MKKKIIIKDGDVIDANELEFIPRLADIIKYKGKSFGVNRVDYDLDENVILIYVRELRG